MQSILPDNFQMPQSIFNPLNVLHLHIFYPLAFFYLAIQSIIAFLLRLEQWLHSLQMVFAFRACNRFQAVFDVVQALTDLVYLVVLFLKLG